MTLREQIAADLVTAQKARDAHRTGVLRMVVAAFQGREIELRGTEKELDEAEITAVLKREAKKRREAATVFDQGGRADLAANERAELEVIDAYLPAQASPEAIAAAVEAVLAAGATEFGSAMKEVMARLGGEADGKLVSEALKARLGK